MTHSGKIKPPNGGSGDRIPLAVVSFLFLRGDLQLSIKGVRLVLVFEWNAAAQSTEMILFVLPLP